MSQEKESPFLKISPTDWQTLAGNYLQFIADGLRSTNLTPEELCMRIEQYAQGFVVGSKEPVSRNDEVMMYFAKSLLSIRQVFPKEACDNVFWIVQNNDQDLAINIKGVNDSILDAYALRLVGLLHVWTQTDSKQELITFQATVLGLPILRLIAFASKIDLECVRLYVDPPKERNFGIVLPN